MKSDKTQQQLAEQIGALLAESLLDEEIKKNIIDGLDKLPEHLVFKLLDVLQTESDELDRVAFDTDLFLKDQDKNWEETAEEQKKTADTVVNKWVEKLK